MKKFFSLLLGACTIFTACTNEDEPLSADNGKCLQINVGVNQTAARSIITGTALPNESQVGVMLDGGTSRDYDLYHNVCYTASEVEGNQTWNTATPVLLSTRTATLYSYFPYAPNTDLSAMRIETDSQTDYMYGTPVQNISEKNNQAIVTMNHALTKVKVSFIKGTYTNDTPVITNVSFAGNAIATAATFNAAQTTPAYVADSFEGVGTPIMSSSNTTFGGDDVEILVIPTGSSSAITINALIDGVPYSVETKSVQLQQGRSYNYKIVLNSTFMSISTFSVIDWLNEEQEDLIIDKVPGWGNAVVATYNVNMTASRAEGSKTVKLINTIDGVEAMMVDGAQITPATTHVFKTPGIHTVHIKMVDNTKIVENQFKDCVDMYSFFLPATVSSYNSKALIGCTNLQKIEVAEGNTVYDSRDNCNAIINTATNTLLNGCKNTVIPDDIECIGTSAFRGHKELTQVNIPESVKKIEHEAFYQCSGLTGELVIPDACLTIGSGYGGDLMGAFQNCTGITKLDLGEGVQTIGDRAFYGCSGLTGELVLPNSIKSLGYVAFYGCKGLTGTLTIPASVNDFDAGIFASCSGIENVVVSEGITSLLGTYGGSYAGLFSGCKNLKKVTLPESLKSIPNEAFYECTALTDINFPSKLNSIGFEAFMGCTGLTGFLDLPLTVNVIGYSAFAECTGITGVQLNDNLTSIQKKTFSNCSNLATISIPQSIVKIEYNAFAYCSNLKEVEIPNSVRIIEYGAFYHSGIESIVLSENLKTIEGGNGLEYNTTYGVFQYCSKLKSITIPEGVESIGSYAFRGCSALESIQLPNSLTSIGKNAFYQCGLKTLNTGNGLQTIGEYAFFGCNAMTEINIGSSLNTIGNGAFYGCTSLLNLNVDDANGTFDSRNNCNAIIETATNTLIKGTSITTIPDNIERIGESAFNKDTRITSITLPDAVKSIGNEAFDGCKNLTSLNLGSGVETIGRYAFKGCTGLTVLNIPNSTTTIGYAAFQYCSGLEKIDFGSGISSVDAYAFAGTTNLLYITSRAKAPKCSYGITTIKEGGILTVPKGCKSAYSSWFDGNTVMDKYHWSCVESDEI